MLCGVCVLWCGWVVRERRVYTDQSGEWIRLTVSGFRGQSPFLVACPRLEVSPEMSPVFTVTNNRPGIQIKKRKKKNNDQTFSCGAYTPRAQASQPAARGTSSSSEFKDVLECPSLQYFDWWNMQRGRIFALSFYFFFYSERDRVHSFIQLALANRVQDRTALG